MNITEFLEARIAEDERRAEGSGVIAWLSFRDDKGAMLHTTVAAAANNANDEAGWVIDGKPAIGYADCTVIYAESHRLAECAAKRAIIAAFDPKSPDLDPFVGLSVMAMLAAVYSDHPDYQQEWAKNG